MAENEPTTGEVSAAPAKSASTTSTTKLLIAVFMAGVILTECAIAYFMIPTPDQVAAVAEARLVERMKETADTVGDDQALPAKEEAPTVEVDLGTYNITYHNGTSMLHIDVALAGTILEEDKVEFDEQFKEKHHRYSQMVNVEFRSAELTDIYSDNLDLIRRRILEKSNALFGKHLLRDVIFSQYTPLEQ